MAVISRGGEALKPLGLYVSAAYRPAKEEA